MNEPAGVGTWIMFGTVILIFVVAIVWGTIRKRNGKSDRLTSSVVEEIRNSKPLRTLVKAEILSTGNGRAVTRTSVGSALGRAAVGGMLAGSVGAVAGAATGKKTTRFRGETTFRLTYGDGHTEIETVSDGTPVWEKYMKLQRHRQ